MDNLPNAPTFNSKIFSWKTLLLSLIGIFFLLSIISNIYLYINLQEQKSISVSEYYSTLPFPFTDTSVSMVGIAYQLKGRVHQITNRGKEYGIVLQGADGKIYSNQPLPIKTENNQPKIGDSIFLNYYFDPLKRTGYVTKVEIVK